MARNTPTSPSNASRFDGGADSEKPVWRGLADRNKPKATRKVKIYKNGDKFFAGKLMTIPKHANLDKFLDLISSTLKGGNPVLRLFSAVDGTEVVDLAQVKDGEAYVAGMSRGKFKKFDYGSILDDRARAELNKMKKRPNFLPNKKLRSHTLKTLLPSLALRSNQDPPRLISVIRNGDVSPQPLRCLLTREH